MSNKTHFTMEGDLVLKVQNALSGIDQLQQKLTKLKLPKENESELTSNYKKLQQEAKNYINIIQKGFKTKQDTKELDASFNKIKKYINEYNNAFNNIDTTTLKKAFDDINGGKISELNKELNTLKENFSNLGSEASKNIKQSLGNIKTEVQNELSKIDLGDKAKNIAKEIDNAFKNTGGTIAKNFGEGRFDLINNNLDKLKERLTNVFKDSGMDSGKSAEFLKQVDEAIKNLNPDPIEDLKQKIAEMAQEIEKLKADNLKQTSEFAKQGGIAAESAKQGFGQLQEGIRGAANEQVRMNSEMDHLKSRIQYFFGLTNGVMLFRRALRQAVQTTKELDEVMTQTAVVSKNTVGDMWAKLPEYSKEAMRLGASIRDVYAAQTLYVQQGLEMDQAMKLGIETLKMARVAGLDAATATDTMTAALRGFKMELNETSVQNINDVYSKLAQNTASNVQEISTAMSKVAALANSANMSFEGTAAYLAKIIESTREGAETAGTALKTVLARFTEVKKLYSEGELTGTDEEGQEVDVNKISKALRTAGIEMNSFFTGAKSMEDVLDELGEKWDSLTVVQQRYIATMAAGSRQQSRFLALMQDWGRTKELVNMANNAEGSGQEQFEKTLESLEVKITNLKNAWNTFIMGLANNSLIKATVDVLKNIIQGVNTLIDKFSGGSGLLKSIMSVAAAFAVFKLGRGLLNNFLGNIGSKMGIAGAQAGKEFGTKFSLSANQAIKGTSITPQINMNNLGQAKLVLKDFYAELQKLPSGASAFDSIINAANNLSTQLKANVIDQEQFDNALTKMILNSNLSDAELKNLQTTLDQLGIKFDVAGTKAQGTSQKISTVSRAASTATMALSLISMALMTWADSCDDGTEEGEKMSKVLKAVGMGLMFLIPIIMLTKETIKTAAAESSAAISSIPIIGWIAAVISALIALISYISNLFSEPPPKTTLEQLEELNEKLEESKKAIKETLEQYQKLWDGLSDIYDKRKALDDLRIGTEEWDNAVQDLNQSIQDLIELYPELIQFLNISSAGVYELDTSSQGFKDYVKQQQTNEFYAKIALAAVEYDQNVVEGLTALEEFEKNNFTWFSEYLGKTKNQSTQFNLIENGKIKSFSLDYGYHRLWRNGEQFKGWDAGNFSQATLGVSSAFPLYALLGDLDLADFNSKIYSSVTRKRIKEILEDEELFGLVRGGIEYFNPTYGGKGNWNIGSLNADLDEDNQQAFQKIGLNRKYYITSFGNRTEKGSYEIFEKNIKREDEDGNKQLIYNLTGLQKIYEQLAKDQELIRQINNGEITSSAEFYDYVSKQLEDWKKYGLEGLNIEEGHEKEFWEAADKYFKTQILSAPLLDQLLYSINTQNVQSENVMSYVLPVMKSELEEFLTTGEGIDFGMDYYNLFFKFLNKNFAKTFNNIYSGLKDLSENELRERFNQRSEESGKTYSQLYREATNKKPGDEITREEMIYFLSYTTTAETMVTGKNNPFIETIKEFENLEPWMRKFLKDYVASSGKFGKITFSTFKKLQETGDLTDKISQDILDILGLSIEGLNEIAEDAEGAFEKYNFIKKKDENGEEIGPGLGDYILEELGNTDIPLEIGMSVAQNANNVLTRTQSHDAAFGYTDIMIGLLDQIDKRLTPENKERAYEWIGQMDPTSNTSILKTINKLGNLGLAVDKLADQIIATTGAFEDFDPEAFKKEIEEITSANTLAKKGVEEGKRTYTASEYASLANIVFKGQLKTDDWSKNWQQLDFDEWVYIGEETNDILSIISDNVATLIKTKYEEIQNKQQAAQGYQDIINDNPNVKWTNEETKPWGIKLTNAAGRELDLNLFGFLQYISNLDIQDIGSEGLITPVNGNYDYMKAAVKLFYPDQNVTELSPEKMLGMLQYIYQEISNLPEYTTQLSNIEAEYDFLKIYGTPQEQLNRTMGYGGKDKEGKIIPINDEDIINQNSDALYGRAISGNYLYTAENIIEQLKAQGITEEKAKNIGYALGYYADQASKKISKLTDALNKNWKAIKENDEDTQEYKDAMNALLPVMSDVLGFKIDKKFINENKKYFDAIIEGGEGAAEAWDELFKIARQKKGGENGELFESFLQSIKIADNDIAELIAKWDDLNGSNLEVGATADFSQLFESLSLTEEQGSALADYLNSLAGLAAEWVVDDAETGAGHIVITNVGGGNTSNKKSGGGGGSKKEFKNDFDKYYNMVEDINELTRLRNLLETDYNQLLESEAASGKAIYDNLKKQIKLLKERRDITADLAEKRKQQILDEIADSDNADLAEYAWWNDEDQTIEINWDAINEVKDSELGDRIKEFVSTLEGFQSEYDKQIEALEEIESTLQEIEKRGRDQYTSLEDRVRDALIKRIQDQIDELTASNEGINTANQNLLDSIQNTLDKQRQERDNAKTEEELSDKEKRLAYLQQDSSNANALEIANLQKELADERENYTDTLIDQKISELQEQNDKAAEQRQEQIDLLQQSLDWQEKNGEFWAQAYEIMNNGFGPDGTLVKGSELEQLLKDGEGWQALSQEGRMNWLSDLEKMVAEATAYLAMSRQLEDIGIEEGKQITFTNKEGQTLTGIVDKDGNVVVTREDGSTITYKNVYQDYDGNYRTFETEEDAKIESKPATGSSTPSTSGTPSTPGTPQDTYSTEISDEWKQDNTDHWKEQYTLKNGVRVGPPEKVQKGKHNRNNYVITGNKYTCYCSVCGHYMGIFDDPPTVSGGGDPPTVSGGGGAGGNNVLKKYATGGLNTETGPAWLDGTKSHPELVLNARDTENFIQLKDHLATLRQMSTNGLFGAGGDNYYDIDVHVDSLGSDYDVDMAIDRIKARIYQDGAYRNVNTLNRLR